MTNTIVEKKIRFHIKVFALYMFLLPIATALSGIIGDISFLNYIAVLFMISSFLSQRMRITLKKEIWLAYAYFIFTCMSISYNETARLNWYVTTFLSNVIIFVLMASDNLSEKEINLIKKSIIGSAFIAIFSTIINIESALNFRLKIEFSSEMDPNDFGCGLIVIVSLLFTRIYNKEKPVKAMILIILCMIIIILTGSRGAMLTFAAISATWMIMCVKNKKILVFALIALVVFLMFYIFYDYIPEFLAKRMDLNSILKDRGGGRFKIWSSAIETFKESDIMKQIMGHGHGSFKRAVRYMARGHSSYYESHNMWLNALIEGGIIGLVLMGGTFIQCFRYARNNKNLCGVMSVVGLAVAGCSLDVQAYRIFAVVFVISIIFSGNDFVETTESDDEKNNKPVRSYIRRNPRI